MELEISKRLQLASCTVSLCMLSSTTCKLNSPDAKARAPRPRLVPAELRARSRITPLPHRIEGTGLLPSRLPARERAPIHPDSAEWFDWLASLTSFRFVGLQGRFTAYRDSECGQRTRCWTAHRCIHGRHY